MISIHAFPRGVVVKGQGSLMYILQPEGRENSTLLIFIEVLNYTACFFQNKLYSEPFAWLLDGILAI